MGADNRAKTPKGKAQPAHNAYKGGHWHQLRELSDNLDSHGMPHVDFTEIKEPLLSAIYYVNNSTGDTLLFDQRFGHKGPLSVKRRIAPKKGRLLVFDGALLHAGNTPRTGMPRVNINFNAFIYQGAHTQEANAV